MGAPGIQILTFNIAEDLGLVEPFMKEMGYTFLVVPACSYVVNLLRRHAIPQNCCSVRMALGVDPVGYGSDVAWVKVMLAKLDTP